MSSELSLPPLPEALKPNYIDISNKKVGNVILIDSLSKVDKDKCENFKTTLQKGEVLAVNINTGELVGVNSHVMSQIEAYLTHGEEYQGAEDVRDISKKYRQVLFFNTPYALHRGHRFEGF